LDEKQRFILSLPIELFRYIKDTGGISPEGKFIQKIKISESEYSKLSTNESDFEYIKQLIIYGYIEIVFTSSSSLVEE
jgi:hypothetical protein